MGTQLEREIREQPAALERLLAGGAPAAIARALHGRELGYVMIAARGSSDNAARYAQYLFGDQLGLPVALAAPSLETLYGAAAVPRHGDALVIGISQSGRSPDVVGVVAAARGAGAPTVAITNDGGSALAHAADFVLKLDGRDRALGGGDQTYTASASRRWRRSSSSCAATRPTATPCGASRRWRSARWTAPLPRSTPSTSTSRRRTSSPWAGATTTRRRWRSP